MTALHKAAQQALEALYEETAWFGPTPKGAAAIAALRAALAQQEEPCPNCASLEAQNTELDRKLAELEQAYQSGYNAGVAHEREACAKVCEQMPDLEHGWRVTLPSDCAAAIRARSKE